MKATHIDWDTDGIDPEELDLPSEMNIPDDVISDPTNEDTTLDEISDYLSDETGFCHNGFRIEK